MWIAIDFGTSHIKAAIFDSEGHTVAQAWRACTLIRPHPNTCEQDLRDVLTDALNCVRECIDAAQLPHTAYAAITLTGQGDGTRLINREGEPIRPAIIWQDSRAVPLVQTWQTNGQSAEVAALTGTRLSGSHQTAQLAWLAQSEPDALRRAWKVLFAKDWLFFHLTGVVGTEQSDSSHTYLNVHSRQVEPRVLETLGLSHLIGLIPPLLQPSETVAGLLPAYAERLGLRSGLPVVLAPFDVVAEMISVGGSEAGVACSVLGTSGIHEVSIERLVTPVRSGDTTYIPGCPSLIRFIPMMLAVPNIEYWGKLLFPELVPPHGYAGWEVLEAQVRAVRPGADGLLYLPFLSPSGERSPYFMPHAHAQFMGLSLSHRREHLMRAVYEGLALATADSFSHLPRFTGSLRLTGGGANSTLLAQIIADVLNCTVEIHDNINGAMRGAIMYAQVQLGYYDTLHDAFTHMEHRRGVCTPDAQAHTTYGQLQQHYRERVRHEWLHE